MILLKLLSDGDLNDNVLVEQLQNITGLEGRLLQCLADESAVGVLDRRAIIGHWLRRQTILDPQLEIKVPHSPDWPSLEQWQHVGLSCQPLDHVYLLKIGMTWLPEWLSATADNIFDACFREESRREFSKEPLDHSVAELLNGREDADKEAVFNSYQAPGQRDAVRGALLAQPGSCLLVNLPTGTGKTMVAQVLAMMSEKHSGLSMLVVPTVGLALELAQRFRDVMNVQGNANECISAWHGDLPTETRKGIRARIRSRQQRLVITSPEAVCTSLVPVLFDAAENGSLNDIIVDEAHLVVQWGNNFRPEFQQLGGLIRGVQRTAKRAGFLPCRTILMSATITEDTRKVLKRTFPGNMTEVHASHLRPEPSYWCAKAKNKELKQSCVMDALAHAPRPLILYCTKPSDAENWQIFLNNAGYQRVGLFTGNTQGPERQKMLTDWQQDKFDIMVATSAFGVGMDKDDVRCVIHATLPENMDRFYQEVGRGGRDGKACASLLIYCEEDVGVARKLAVPKLINKKGPPHWRRMWDNAKEVEDNLYLINVDEIHHELEWKSQWNRTWNLRTVVMLMRAEVIEIDMINPPLPRREKFVDESAYEDAIEKHMQTYKYTLVVRPLVEGHTQDEIWKEYIYPSRHNILIAAERNHLELVNWLSRSQELFLCDVLADVYTLPDVWIEPACGGCPACRHKGGKYSVYEVPQPRWLPGYPRLDSAHEKWQQLTGLKSRQCLIMYPLPGDSNREQRRWLLEIISLTRRLTELGIILAIEATEEKLNALFEKSNGLPVTFFSKTCEEDKLALPELKVPEVTDVKQGYRFKPLLKGPLQLVFVPETMPDVNRIDDVPYKMLDHQNWIDLEILNQKINSFNAVEPQDLKQ